MCIDPLTLGAIASAASSVAGGVMGMQQANAQSKIANRQADAEAARGSYEHARQKAANDRQLAAMRGNYLSSGIALEGSAADAIESSAVEASLDEQAILYGAQARSDNLRYEAKMAKASGQSAMVGGIMGGITPFINLQSQRKTQNQQMTMIRNPYATGGGLY
jgi:hypothetical protein